MSKEVLCIILLVVFFAIMIYVGFYSRKHATDVNGFVLGGRGVGPWLTAFAFGTSYFSAVIFVGYAGQFGWNFGLASTWAGLGNAFIGSLLAWNVLGRRTRIMTQHVDAKTMPDFFGKRFDSVPLKVTASVIVFIFLIPYTASLYNGLSSLCALSLQAYDCILSISTVCCAGQTYCRKQDEQYQDLLSYCTKETKNKGRMKKFSFFMRPLRGTCPPSPTSRR